MTTVRRPLIVLLAAVAVGVGACGGEGGGGDPVDQVPQASLRARLSEARSVRAADFPPVRGQSLEELGAAFAGGPELGLASSVLTVGENRLAFGVIDAQGQFVYGKTAVYVARRPGAAARGPFPAPADVLVTEPAFRSRQAATESDPFAAVYAASVRFDRPGRWTVLAVTRVGDRAAVAAASEVQVIRSQDDRIPAVGERAPRVATDTLTSVRGDRDLLDTREPPSDMHARSFAEVVGKRPVALLFATPQLCQSRVCGPVVDIALQLKRTYGDRVEFIHQEVYVDNDPRRGVREPLRRFNLPTEPWLFVVDREGRITARLEGSFGLDAFRRALETAL